MTRQDKLLFPGTERCVDLIFFLYHTIIISYKILNKQRGNLMAEYTDLTISLRLSDACIRSESRYEWIADSESGTWEIRGIDFYDLFEGPAYCAGQLSYAAYSEEELLFMLPSDIMNRIRMKGKISYISHLNSSKILIILYKCLF